MQKLRTQWGWLGLCLLPLVITGCDLIDDTVEDLENCNLETDPFCVPPGGDNSDCTGTNPPPDTCPSGT